MVVTKVTGQCQMFVQGTSMRCPLCSTVVQSGVMHECQRVESQPAKAAPKRKRLSKGPGSRPT